MLELKSFIRPELLNFKPYTSARHLAGNGGILLDANENPFDKIIDISDIIANRYPDPSYKTLRDAFSDYIELPGENIFAGAGSDEIIDLLLRLFCVPNQDGVVIIEPTYGMYKVSSELNGVIVRSCLLGDDFDIDISKLHEAVSEETKLVFCCSPNNPT
ncbi:MAG: aminotransferase class I/II-fold pyridoxal phosphate-dependent enzyme, partial [Candidatus Marinimicrobia bacterium]|nr:aminotransferase class I/II-fold pyridoxal phosphate-dependent enzyme [Candidatus Neomarinimicrobiota bacterium]